MIEWKLEKRKISSLKSHPKNPRQLTKDQAVHLEASLSKFGAIDKPIINTDNTVIGGHQRIKTLKKMGIKEIDCWVPNEILEEKDVDELNIRLNKNTGEWDWDVLANQWEPDDLLGWGFDLDDLVGASVEQIDGDAEDDDFEEVLPEQPKTKPGDIYELGQHKLICASATSLDDIQKILLGEQVDLVITDPPYNVAYVGKTKDALTIQNDQISNQDFESLLRDFYVNAFCILKEGAGIYVFHADLEGERFRRYWREAGIKLAQCLIWEKQTLVMGRQDYHWQHEPCLYGWKEGAAHNWYSDRKQTTLLKFDRPQRNAEHPTMKPIPLISYLMNNSSKRGDIVFDFFLGSGTTIMAAEQTGRRCFGTELDPKYCDVIVDRWRSYMVKSGKEYEIKLNGEIQNEER